MGAVPCQPRSTIGASEQGTSKEGASKEGALLWEPMAVPSRIVCVCTVTRSAVFFTTWYHVLSCNFVLGAVLLFSSRQVVDSLDDQLDALETQLVYVAGELVDRRGALEQLQRRRAAVQQRATELGPAVLRLVLGAITEVVGQKAYQVGARGQGKGREPGRGPGRGLEREGYSIRKRS